MSESVALRFAKVALALYNRDQCFTIDTAGLDPDEVAEAFRSLGCEVSPDRFGRLLTVTCPAT